MLSINLVPVEIKNKIKISKKNADQVSIVLVIFIVFIVVTTLVSLANSMVLVPNLKSVKDEIKTSESKLASFGTVQTQAVSINDRVRLAAKIEEKRPKWSEIIQELINSVPQTVQFSSFNADSSKSPNFVLQAQTDTERNIVVFKDKLESSSFFKNVAFKSSNSKTNVDSTAKVVTFSLEFDAEKLFSSPNQKETK